MAFITLDTEKLKHNFNNLDALFKHEGIDWAVVGKLLCGNETFLKEVLALNPKQICDSRVSNLKMIKKLNQSIETIYIKPAPNGSIDEIIEYADISFNTELETIKLLSEEATKQNKTHKIVIMVELGELREGVLREDLIDFYEQVFTLPNIEVIGLGTNLTCMYGVLPNQDKLIQLSLYKELLELKFNRKIPYLSGGASVTIPLVLNKTLPADINHFRIGETLFMGTNAYDNTEYEDFKQNVFTLHAEIIELHEKPMMPDGEIGLKMTGEKVELDPAWENSVNYRAIIDLGLLDIEEAHITPINTAITFVGSSSDMMVIDLQDNPNSLKVGDTISFHMNYMGILRIMNSNYITKVVT
ncbi:alanine racemase [Myroides marinus]|uniref:alanine racemase n=1 Tax=Myroides marinus TaxID=703342 RepID=UPI002576B525|nr:alanine racemase [Myroides marinus]MDM1346685.1 alanine racemase [Myroides marinus]MDM1350127.1 alanine racemase [Myroides marinus]MDM1357254.1 alanine racemase [Myroides marinus]MDM1362129.1 alanine racemase [Myroides marinus]MDM1364220.1 alanine racemase [Myroides marinus]